MMKQKKRSQNLYLYITLILFISFVTGCNKNNPEQAFDEQSPVRLKAVKSSAEFENNLKIYLTRMIENNQIQNATHSQWESQRIETDSALPAIASSSTPNVSGTNVVEVGVDEADIVKSDGHHLFIARQKTYGSSTTGIAATRPVDGEWAAGENTQDPATINVMQLDNDIPAATALTTIVLSKRVSNIVGLYLSDFSKNGKANQLIVVSDIVKINKTPGIYAYQGNTSVTAYDISSPDDPNKQWEFEVEGNINTSRSMNGKLYLITSKSLWLNRFNTALNNEKETIKQIENLSIDDILPATWLNGVATHIVEATNCMAPEITSKETVFNASLLAVFTIPVDAPEKTQSFCTLESNSEIYTSNNAIYFTKGEYVSLSDGSNNGKNYTVIHKLKFTEDSVAYQSSVRVPGWTGWQSRSFRMSELNDDLRIVVSEFETANLNNDALSVTEGPEMLPITQRRTPVHRLYILREIDEKLSILSSLPNESRPEAIGKPGEDIYSVRYFGDYVYIVTFRRTDPLYAINLKNPAMPFIEGELSIPGFSNYLHPISNDLLLGIGKEATDTGAIQGLKIALFDVSDKSNPLTLRNLVLGKQGSHSAVDYDYRAFSISSDPATGAHKVTLPVSIYNKEITKTYDNNRFTYYQWSYSGLLLLNIDDETSASGSSMRNAGVIKSVEASKEKTNHYVFQPRSVLVDDAVHYIENANVWSANWDQPNINTHP